MRIHMFVDAENISNDLFFFAYNTVCKEHRIVVHVDVYGKIKPLWFKENEFRFIKSYCGKNSADTFMTADIVRCLYEEVFTDVIVVLTNDKDFIPSIMSALRMKKKVWLFSVKDSIAPHLESFRVDTRRFKFFEMPHDKKEKDLGFIHFDIPKTKLHLIKDVSRFRTCYIKTKSGTILEVPFYEGIDMNLFTCLIPLKKIKSGYSKSKKLREILLDSYIYVKDNRVYVDVDSLFQ